MDTDIFYQGDVLQKIKLLPDGSVHCAVTSPPYFGLRKYGDWKMQSVWYGSIKNFTFPKHPVKNKNYLMLLKMRADRNGIVWAKNKKTHICAYGLEPTPELYIKHSVTIFKEIRRVLRDDGTLWLNIGDSYWGGKGTSGSQTPEKQNERFEKGNTITKSHQTIGEKGYTRPADGKHAIIKPKDLIGIPWMLAFALRADGWYLRQDIIWNKPNPMPESVTDRCTKAHEYIFLLTKSAKYYFDQEAIKTKAINPEDDLRRILAQTESNKSNPDAFVNGLRPRKSGNIERKDRPDAPENNGKHQKGSVPLEGATANKKTVWTVTTKPYKDAHFATFPEDLIIDCIKAGSSEHGCCSTCGAPYKRILEKDIEIPDTDGNFGKNGSKWKEEHKQSSGHRIQKNINALRSEGRDHDNPWAIKKTIGWKQGCKCKSEKVPCIVLDPFSGAGTTALVAKKLDRNFIGIELNEKYVQMSVKRLQKEIGMFYKPVVK